MPNSKNESLNGTFPQGTPDPTRDIFQKIKLQLHSGAPLHEYRLSEGDVRNLQFHLMDAVQYRRLGMSAAPFVIWAAETFRRDFDGGQYTWKFLTSRLRFELDIQDLYAVTRKGLNWFGRGLTMSDGGATYYLKTLAAEGGLPEALLADTTGHHRRLVRSLMSDIEKVGAEAPREILMQITARRASTLSLGFRTDEFHHLLLEFCLKLLELRVEIPTAVLVEARQAWLDANRSGWKENLPLRVESAAAQSLLLDAVTADTSPKRHELASRLLVRVGDAWVPKVSIAQAAEIPDWLMNVADARLRSIRLLPDTSLSQAAPSLVLSADRDTNARLWDVRRVSASRRSIHSMPLDRPVAFRMVAEGRTIGLHTPPGGQAIDPDDIPTVWSVEEKGDHGLPNSLRKIGSSSLRSRANHLWVLAGIEAAHFEGLDAVEDGMLGTATLWRVSGRGRVYGNGWSLSLETGADEDTTDRLVVHGDTLPGLRDRLGMELYQGLPMFYSQTAGGTGRHLTANSLRWRPAGKRDWRNGLPDPQASMGLHQFGWRDEAGATRAFTSVRLMPASAIIMLADLGDGELEFRSSGVPQGTTITLAGSVTGLVRDDGTLTLKLGDRVAHLGRIAVHFHPPEGTGRPFDATLPRPGAQGYFVDADDNLLREDLTLDLGMLAGWRVLTPPNQDAELRIRLHGENAPHQPITITVQNDSALSTILPRLRGLMALGGPDCELRLRVLVGASQSRRITLRRYLREGQWNGTALSLGQDDMDVVADGLDAQIVNLMAPTLSCSFEGLQPGQDILPRLPEHPGPWMMFAKDAGGLVRPPRPLTKTLAGNAIAAPSFSDSLFEAGQSARRSDRIAAFGTDLRNLLDPLRTGDLALYEQQIDDLIDGEALSSLDSVVALAQAPELAALLLLRSTPGAFASRLELESVSPFSWTTLPLGAWEQALRRQFGTLIDQMTANGITAQDARKFSETALSLRLREIIDRRPEIAGQIIFASANADLMSALLAKVTLPHGLANPGVALLEEARRAIARHEAATQAFDLRSSFAPPAFDNFHEPMRGLLDAPLVAAEHVLGHKPHPPNVETAVALLHYRLHDPDYFETAMPAAIAHINQQVQ